MEIRKQYRLRRHRLGQLAAAAAEASVMEVVGVWNAMMPAKRIRVLTQERFDLVQEALWTYSLIEIASVIEFYSNRVWNKAHGAWRTFEHFFDATVLAEKFEQMTSEAEKAADRKPPADKRVGQLAGSLGEKFSADDRAEKLRRRWDGLTAADRRRLWDLGRKALAEKYGPDAPLTQGQILAAAMEVMDAETA